MANKNNISITYDSTVLNFNTMYEVDFNYINDFLKEAVNEAVVLIKKYCIKDKSKADFLICEVNVNTIRRLICLGFNPITVYTEIIQKLPYWEDVK